MTKKTDRIKRAAGASLALCAILIVLCICSAWFPHTLGQNRGPAAGILTRAKSGVLYSESHALIIGVSHYHNGWPDLPGVSEDVIAVKKVLEKHGFQVQESLNPDRQRFDQTLRDFIGKHGQNLNNRLVIYFAGHGHTLVSNDGKARRTGYLVPADAPTVSSDDVGPFKSVAVSMEEVETHARQINSKHALFVFDSCFSGELFKLRGGVPDSISYKLDEPVRQFITAGTEKQSVPDKSYFRRQFVLALEGEADANCDGYITGTELGEFLQTTVTNYTKRAQTPQYGKIKDPDLDRGDSVFAILDLNTRCNGQLREEENNWKVIENSSDFELFRAYLVKYPSGAHSEAARSRLKELGQVGPGSGSDGSSQPKGTWDLLREESVIVSVGSSWTRTLLKVERDQLVKVNASGQVSFGSYGYGGPRGVAADDRLRPSPDCGTGALIAKVESPGTKDSPLICLKAEGEFTASVSGELMLGVNESRTNDNSGRFNVRIRVFGFKR